MGSFAARYAAFAGRDALAALWGDSRMFNIGLWPPGVPTVAEASAALVDEVAARLPRDGRILDLGCGEGGGTRRLAAGARRSRIVGLELVPARLIRAARDSRIDFVAADATQLPFADRSFAGLVAIESAFHFDSRRAFFAESARALAPRGVLVLADFLIRDRDAFGADLVPAGNDERDLESYARALARAGFAEIELDDATERTWKPFCRALAARPDPPPPERMARLEASVAAYVLARAVNR
ncbi:MAG: methyltransferase domain-containing protein [Thermoanaerobaculia bacterium]